MAVSEINTFLFTDLSALDGQALGTLSEVDGLAITAGCPPFTITDNFNRADDAAGLGIATTGETWVTQINVIGILTNQAHTYGLVGGNAISTIEANCADIEVACTMTAVANNSTTGGLVFRYVDTSNYWRYIDIGSANGNVKLEKKVAGVTTGVYDSGPTAATVPFELKINANGSTIEIYLAGVLVDTKTDSDLMTATKHGLFSSGGTPTEDNFSITNA